jgi:hypothetical protein
LVLTTTPMGGKSSSSNSSCSVSGHTVAAAVDKRAAFAAFAAEKASNKRADLEDANEDLQDDAQAAGREAQRLEAARALRREAGRRLAAVWQAQAEQRSRRAAGEREAARLEARGAVDAVREEQAAFEEYARGVKEAAARRGLVWAYRG